MIDSIVKIIDKLKELIDENGPNYLADDPYDAFTKLMKSEASDRRTASAILCFLANGMLDHVSRDSDFAELSEQIQKECGFNKKMADWVTSIFVQLYSQDNEEEWENRALEGLESFRQEEFVCTWEGYAYWYAGGGGVDCHYEAEIVLMPGGLVVDADLVQALRKNSFMTKEAIGDHYRKSLKEYLDIEFEEYCTCEDYYQPVVEGFEIDYRVADWSRKSGFEVISCEGDGHDDGYEPDFRQGWY